MLPWAQTSHGEPGNGLGEATVKVVSCVAYSIEFFAVCPVKSIEFASHCVGEDVTAVTGECANPQARLFLSDFGTCVMQKMRFSHSSVIVLAVCL
jgi:hypothetical protein